MLNNACTLHLHVRQGPALPCLKLARKAAALETIKKLFESGELIDSLKPISHKEMDSDEEDENKIEGKAHHNAGTTKKRTHYDVKVCLVGVILIFFNS